MLFQQIPDTARVLQCRIAFGKTVFVQLIVPTGFIVLPLVGVIAGEQTIIEAKIFTHDQAGIGIGLGVFTVVFFVSQQIQHHA
ncbi:Uncharacterised protein [Salmonella enterica subsp. enterica serovar Bovismorbificans]|uniref:Uncharacterized protein n=1 Tax=Salmonella enterica subsp. enterica serovar Bovismorbificans TaxID=58097 RepID=A0A655BYL2_SALET|nr:Uncharacterised protein [Salmonella enterica subsp. enterica serovar Bovismorbificans]CNU31016.1 Uncharacterised protein [Salmonella enterica subsp. enterica serovar Bovismorbificans]CNU65803.1 Uncharacterised protein [Salmonella enterica subsp. enterica serovar Bovismorbificans]CPR51952.1 Uncharacterised protein [Salmonella enterica subsp. enterica serovar Bovismorbificans]CQB66064.1 Uncharacterised protein [Salmonella enterica subsp. enterica serovar Bovismorbificans]